MHVPKDILPAIIPDGMKALFYDPAGAKNRDGGFWCPVVLTGLQGTFRNGVRFVQIYNNEGKAGRTLDATYIKLS